MSVYGYVRVSTIQQVRGESLDVQSQIIQGYSIMYSLVIDKIFIESGCSGSIKLCERPIGSELMKCIKSGDIVICAKLDRLFRSSLDALFNLELFKSRGIQLHIIDLGGDVFGGIGKLVFTILSAVSESERDRISERISVVKASQKSRNRYLGGPVPYGYMREGDILIKDEYQQSIILKVKDLKKKGYSLRRIKSELNLTISLPTINKI